MEKHVTENGDYLSTAIRFLSSIRYELLTTPVSNRLPSWLGILGLALHGIKEYFLSSSLSHQPSTPLHQKRLNGRRLYPPLPLK